MTSIRKMALIPADMANRTIPPPQAEQLNQIDMQMKKVLESEFPADVKFKLYNHVLRQHDVAEEETKKPVKIEIKDEGEAKRKHFPNKAALLRGIPKTKQEAAQVLYDHLTKRLDFDENDALIVNDSPVANTNVRDLFHYAIRDLSLPPTGWNIFYDLLRSTNVPQAAIANTRVRMLPRRPQTGRGFKFDALYK